MNLVFVVSVVVLSLVRLRSSFLSFRFEGTVRLYAERIERKRRRDLSLFVVVKKEK